MYDVFKQAQLEAQVPGFQFFPRNLGQLQVRRIHDLSSIIVGAVRTVLIIHQAFGTGRITRHTPTGRKTQHVDNFVEGLEEFLIADVPTTRYTGEDTPLLTRTETRATIGTERQGDGIFRIVRIVHRCEHSTPVSLIVTGRRSRQVARNSGVGNAAADTRRSQRLRRVVLRRHFSLHSSRVRVLRISEVRRKVESVTGCKRQVLEFVVRRTVDTLTPRTGGERRRIVSSLGVSIYIHKYLTAIVELRFVVVLTKELVVHDKLWLNGIGRLFVPCFVGDSHGITIVHHVSQVIRSQTAVGRYKTGSTCSRRHDEIFACVEILTHTIGRFAILVTVNRHIRHGVVGATQNIGGVVAVILGVSQGEVAGESDAVRYIVVQSQTCGKAVKRLLDDSTCFVVVST